MSGSFFLCLLSPPPPLLESFFPCPLYLLISLPTANPLHIPVYTNFPHSICAVHTLIIKPSIDEPPTTTLPTSTHFYPPLHPPNSQHRGFISTHITNHITHLIPIFLTILCHLVIPQTTAQHAKNAPTPSYTDPSYTDANHATINSLHTCAYQLHNTPLETYQLSTLGLHPIHLFFTT